MSDRDEKTLFEIMQEETAPPSLAEKVAEQEMEAEDLYGKCFHCWQSIAKCEGHGERCNICLRYASEDGHTVNCPNNFKEA